MRLNQQVKKYSEENPLLTAPEIAKHFNKHPAYVRSTSKRLGFNLPKAKRNRTLDERIEFYEGEIARLKGIKKAEQVK